MDADRLARAHVAQVVLAVVRLDVHLVQRHDRHQRRAGRHVVADLDRAVAHHAVHGRRDRRVADVEFGLPQVDLGAPQGGTGGAFQGAQPVGLLLCCIGGGDRLVDGRPLDEQVGARLLLALRRAGAVREKIVVALRLLLREDQGRLRVGEVGVSLDDARLLLDQRRTDALQLRLGLVEIGLVLEQHDLVVAVVDAGDHLAGAHRLIVGDAQLRDEAADLRRDRDLVGLEERVIGHLPEAAIRPPMPPEMRAVAARAEDEREQDELLRSEAARRLRARRIRRDRHLKLRLRAFRRRRTNACLAFAGSRGQRDGTVQGSRSGHDESQNRTVSFYKPITVTTR